MYIIFDNLIIFCFSSIKIIEKYDVENTQLIKLIKSIKTVFNILKVSFSIDCIRRINLSYSPGKKNMSFFVFFDIGINFILN